MSIAGKLQLGSGFTVAVLGLPENVDLDLPDDVRRVPGPAAADVVIAFAIDSVALDPSVAPAIATGREDRLAWIAYPKAGRPDTDLDRNALADLVQRRRAQAVRQVAVDDTWSAMRFRPVS